MAASDAFVSGFRVTSTGEQYVKFDSETGGASPDGVLQTAGYPTSLFYDGFDAAPNTAVRWTSSGTVAPSVTLGLLTVQPGTTALGNSVLVSKPSFPLLGNMFVNAIGVWKVDATAKTGAYRFFGLGNPQGAPTVAAPITDGAGFEYSATDGSLNYVIWAAGVRTAVAPISNAATAAVIATLNNGDEHRYSVFYKTSTVYFQIDNVVMARVSQPNLTTSTLPVLALHVNGAATVTPAAVSTFSFIGVGDTAGNNQEISSASFPWRKLEVDAGGAAATGIGGLTTVAIGAAGSANVKAAPGRLGKVLITVAGTTALTFYDNATGAATGTIIGITPTATTAGQVFEFDLPAAAGISAVGGAGSPGVTVGYN